MKLFKAILKALSVVAAALVTTVAVKLWAEFVGWGGIVVLLLGLFGGLVCAFYED